MKSRTHTSMDVARIYAHAALGGIRDEHTRDQVAEFLNVALAESDEPVTVGERLYLATEALRAYQGSQLAIRRGSRIAVTAFVLGFRQPTARI